MNFYYNSKNRMIHTDDDSSPTNMREVSFAEARRLIGVEPWDGNISFVRLVNNAFDADAVDAEYAEMEFLS